MKGFLKVILVLFFFFFFVLIGSELGRNNLEKAKEAAKKLIAITLFLAFFVVFALVLIAPLFLLILTSPKEVHYLNSYYLILIFAFVFPFMFSRRSFSSSLYGPLQSASEWQNKSVHWPQPLCLDQHSVQSNNRHNGIA